ncbi:very large A-kinase anchor protein isoform X1 [Pseudonaja textilis]|uniref:Crystallin beta-gamma domain containing 3 n=1 Tax=Pseudonaja textilis TaxID=8673 RepID=A0A670Y2C1_PSETE|nr:very large A-kinase anchor protein isoform X1 [Pseudonaja textilis]
MSGGSTRRRTASPWHSNLSRLFMRSSSKEQEEENKVAPEQRCARSFEIKEEESTDVICPRKESSPLPELLKVSVCKNKDFSTEGLNRSTTQEELKKAQSLPSLIHESKTNNNNKRSKEGFLQYLGSLFGISSKSSYKEKEPSNFGDGHCKMKQGFSDQSNHQDKRPTEHLKSKIFAISNFETEQNIPSKEEDSNLRIKSSPQHLQKPQDQSAETAKKTESEPPAYAITYATYRGSARIKQLLKKQADLEQETVTRTSISNSTVESKKEEITNTLSSESTKEPESLVQNGKSKTKDDKQNLQENMLWSEMNQKEDIQSDCEHNELKNKITFLTEIETIENCVEELESVKCVSVSDKSEINRKLLLEPPAFLPNQVSSSYQNINSASISSENSRLDEKRKALEEIHMQLQSNNVSTVCFKKEAHFCVSSNTETKETIQNEFSSYPEKESTNNDHQLLEDKYSWTDDRFKLESVNPSYMNSHNCSDQINNNEQLNTDMMTENHSQLFFHKPAGTEELPLVFKSRMSALSTENGSELLLCSKRGLESKETTEPLLLRDLQNNSRISIMANIRTSKVSEENVGIPVVELDAVLSNDTEENKANISLLDTEYTHVDSFKTDASNVPQSLEAKNDCYPVKRNENKTLIQPLNSLNICSSLEKQNKLFELENMRHVKNTDMSSLKTTKNDAIKTPIISGKTSNSVLNSIRNNVKPPENKEFSCLSVISSENECLTHSSLPGKPDKTNLPPDNSSSLLPVLISNANIFEDNIHLDTLAKSASNSKDQNFLKSSYFLPDEQEYMLQSARVTTAANSAETDFSEICYSDSVSENSKAVLKSHFFLESGNNFKSHVMHDTIDRDSSGKKSLPRSNETKYLTSSYSMDSESILIKESFPELTSDNIHVPKSAIPTTSSKDSSDLHSPACEAVEAVFDNINSLHINSEDTVKLSSKDELSSLSSESISDVTYSPPLIASVTYYMDIIDSSESEIPLTNQQCKEIHTTPSGQNSNCLMASPSKIATRMEKQAIAALFSKSNNQFFKEPLKNVETGKQLQIKSQNLTLLFKKADEIVDEVLHLAIEEIRSKQTAYICQNNDTKYNESPSSQKDHTNTKMMSESKKMQSGNSSLKPFNVNDITNFTGLKFDSETQNEKEPLNITDKTDLHNSVTVKPKEITDNVIKTAKQNPAVVPYEKHLSQDFSQNTNMCYTEASEILITDAELSTKLSERIGIPLNLSPVFPNEEQKITVEGVANVSVPFNFTEESKEVSGEIIPKNVCSGQTICEEWYDDITEVNSSRDKIHNAKYNKDDDCTTNRAIVGDITSSWICENQCNLVKGEAVKTCKQLSACSVLTRNVLPFNSNINTYGSSSDKYEYEQTFGSPEHNIENDFPKNEIKSEAITAERKEPHQKYYEINSEWGSSKIGKEDIIQQDTKFNVLFNISESSLLNNSSNIGFVHGEVVNEDPCLIADNVPMEYSLDVDSANENKSPNCFAFPTPEHWEHNSSFNILYKDSLQDESYSFSGEEIMSTLSHPDLSLDNKHKMYETSRLKDNLFASYDESKQLTEMLGDTCSESFMTVEAKRYRIYPFSLSPIYEDDGSQEDLSSTDISPRNHYSGSPRENQSLSVLSLLQSVSEKLKSSNQYNENEQDKLYEEKNQEEEKEISISSIWQGNKNTEFPKDFSRQFISKEVFHSEETSSLSSTFAVHFIQKSDSGMKPFLKDTYSENLPGLGYLAEKGNTLGSRILPADPPSKSTKLLKLVTCQKCPVGRNILKCNPRPGKMLIYDFHGNTNKLEIYRDVVDATLWMFSKEALIAVIRGCWILYEKPTFQGQKYVLEEGERMLTDILNLHREKAQGSFTIGSIKHITKDCSIPEIELCSHNSHFSICMQTGIANLDELEVENPIISVKAGVWLAYSDTDYKGEKTVLEENQSPCKLSATDVKSFRPLEMGGLKVQMPMNTMMIIYERPHFGGWCKTLSENIDCIPILFENSDAFQGIGSIRVIGGIWVAYNKERYKGRQYLLEEGEYEHWQSWGGDSSVLLSVRFLQANFMESEVTLFKTDEENGKVLDIINQGIPDLEWAGFGLVTRSINVKSGVWVAYQQKYFCGEQYILEKGKYKCFLDWGGTSETIMSIRPIKLEPLGDHQPIHWIKAFDNVHFQGSCIDFTTEAADFTSFIPRSFKVLRGCWLLYYQGKTAVEQCVLEEDLYPDLASCGCSATKVKSLKPVDHVFAEPFISLFALENCEGKELHLQEATSSLLNKEFHFLTQSIWVKSGTWIAYEGCNFLGKQFLLESSKISNWTQFSGWKTIGSLRPIKQPALYFRIKNRSLGKYLTVAGSLMDGRATSVCLFPQNGKNTQIWHYSCGLIKSKVNDACLDVIGGRDIPGAKVALWAKHGKPRQKWTYNKDGTITSYLNNQLVLDIKGGDYYDKNHIIVNQLNINELTQKWDFEIL